jgi:hypothetical protein
MNRVEEQGYRTVFEPRAMVHWEIKPSFRQHLVGLRPIPETTFALAYGATGSQGSSPILDHSFILPPFLRVWSSGAVTAIDRLGRDVDGPSSRFAKT